MPEPRSGTVAKQRCLSGGEHSRDPPPPTADPTDAVHEDPAMHLVQLAALDPPIYGAAAHPKVEQLPPAHHRVLSPSKLSCGSVPFASR